MIMTRKVSSWMRYGVSFASILEQYDPTDHVINCALEKLHHVTTNIDFVTWMFRLRGRLVDRDIVLCIKSLYLCTSELLCPNHHRIFKWSCLFYQADASERLRQSGLSHLYPHPVLVKQTRSCPLEPPPPPEQIPKWKLIRPRKKKTTPSDEPKGRY